MARPTVNKSMEPNATSAPTYYNSCYEHLVDEKRRVAIPAKWRPAEEGIEFTLVLWPQAQEGTCIRVLPPQEMAKLVRNIEAMPSTDPGKVALKRAIGAGSIQAAVDRSGRICLPEDMAKAAGVTEKAVLLGLLDRFEIWSPERYQKVKASAAVIAQEAFKLME